MTSFSHSLTSKEKAKNVTVTVEVGFSIFQVSCPEPQRRNVYFFVFYNSLKSQRFTLSPLASLCDAFPLPIKILKELQNIKMLGSCRKCLEILYNLKRKAV